MMGYDSLLFDDRNDSHMVRTALTEGRVILTRDIQIMKRRPVTSGRLKAVLIESDQPERQIRQVMDALKLDCRFKPFTICLECNRPLEERSPEQVKDRVPPYVFRTQSQYMECPACRRLYWRGTHWEAMTRRLETLARG
jgi:uncharacterized protein with PIN domain